MINKIKCILGFHKWEAKGPTRIEHNSKWDSKEIAIGICTRCGELAEIRRDYNW